MFVDIIQTGSAGNCSVIRDCDGNQLIIDCGIKFERILPHLNGIQKTNILITHFHGDHILSLEHFKRFLVPIYCPTNDIVKSSVELISGEAFTIDDAWHIVPVFAPHGFGKSVVYIIDSIAEKKKILWATDCQRIPIKTGAQYDFMALECNWDADYVYMMPPAEKSESGYKNHMELGELCFWMSFLKHKPKHVAIIHTSNSGLLVPEIAVADIGKYAEEAKICRKDCQFTF